MNNPLPFKVCTRCDCGVEYYVLIIDHQNKKEIVLCSDCCISFINFELSTRPHRRIEIAFIDYATNTHP